MSQALDLPKGVHIVAQPDLLPAIDAISQQVTCVACAINEPLPVAAIVNASLIVIEVDPASRSSLDRIDRLRNEMPSVPVIAGLAKVDIATSRQLLRRGVSDIVALPFAIDVNTRYLNLPEDQLVARIERELLLVNALRREDGFLVAG